jgi:hypothetical protein
LTETEPSRIEHPPAKNAMAANPTFLSGLKGIWLFTWKSRLRLGNLPMQLVALFVLPVLILLTTSSQVAWTRRQAHLGNPPNEVSDLLRRMQRAGAMPQPEQKQQLHAIFSEEFLQAEREHDASNAEDAGEQTKRLEACYARIHQRVQGILNEAQMSQFRNSDQQPSWNRTAPFYHWLIDFYFFVILPLICVGASGSLIREDLQADTLGFLTTRPITRARLLIAKYLCQSAWLQIALALEAMLLCATGAARGVDGIMKLMLLFLPIQALAVFAWSALGTFLGLVTRRFMAIALVYGFIVEMGIGRIPTNINTLSIIRNLKTLLSHNASLQSAFHWAEGSATVSLVAIGLATVVFLAAAAFLFTFKEYHHTTEMQK